MNEIAIGDVTITRIEEMHGPIMPPKMFFPTIPESAWDEHRNMLVPDHLDAEGEMVQVAMQTWLLRSDGRTILVDTGVGNDKARPAVEAWDHLHLDYLGALDAADVRPEDVDLVVNTHLHVDHVGWNTVLRDGEWVPTFPNATYLMTEEDFVFWDPARVPRPQGDGNQNVFEDSVAPVHRAGQVRLWSGEHRIDSDLVLEAAPGHTPGSAILRVESKGSGALFLGDIIHAPVQFATPDVNSCFCEDPALARSTRRRLLDEAVDRNLLVVPGHFGGHSACHIRRGDGSESRAFIVGDWADLARV
jgi:glyoxylase-like metal-dependent hydrolase (beta-lactamase superfamily II)